jgi:hypothetical protein
VELHAGLASGLFAENGGGEDDEGRGRAMSPFPPEFQFVSRLLFLKASNLLVWPSSVGNTQWLSPR